MKRYAFTVAVVSGFVFAQWLLWPIVKTGPFIFLYPALVVSALYGSAPLALGLCMLAAQYLFFEPRYSFRVAPQVFLLQGMFAVAGTLIWRLAALRQRGFQQAVQARKRYANLASELHTTLASIGDAVISTDTGGVITFVNHAAEQITGWTAHEAVGQPLTNVFCIYNAHTHATVESPTKVVLRSGGVVGLANDTVLRRRDGSEVDIEDSAAPIRLASGAMAGVVLVFRDASASRLAQRRLQQSEQQFRALFNLAGVGMFQLDPATARFVRVNSKFCTLMGYSEAELLSKNARDLVHPDHRQVGEQELADLLDGRSTDFEVESCCVAADGRVLTVLCNTVLISANPLQIVTSVQDITAAKANEARLQEAIRARDQFLSMASHELKTPLTSSKLQSQLRMRYLRRNDADAFSSDKLAKMLQNDAQQIDRLVRLVDDMLDISRINSGKLTLQREPFDLGQLVRDVLERFELQLVAAGCAVDVEAAEPVNGVWDRFRVEQVVINLLTNAMRYGAKRPIHIGVACHGHTAELQVQDHGRGISVHDQERIFECFERAVPATEISGLGLGLYIANRIATLHGGRIEVDSQPGEGATFTVQMPLDNEAWERPA